MLLSVFYTEKKSAGLKTNTLVDCFKKIGVVCLLLESVFLSNWKQKGMIAWVREENPFFSKKF